MARTATIWFNFMSDKTVAYREGRSQDPVLSFAPSFVALELNEANDLILGAVNVLVGIAPE